MSNEYYRIWNKAKLNIRTAIKKILNGHQWKSTGMTFLEEMKSGKQFSQKPLMVIQKNLIKSMVTACGARTYVSLYDKETGEYKEVSLKELYDSLESDVDDKIQKEN